MDMIGTNTELARQYRAGSLVGGVSIRLVSWRPGTGALTAGEPTPLTGLEASIISPLMPEQTISIVEKVNDRCYAVFCRFDDSWDLSYINEIGIFARVNAHPTPALIGTTFLHSVTRFHSLHKSPADKLAVRVLLQR